MKLFEIKKNTPKWQIFESKEGKNLHLEHIEDLIFNEGYQGAQRALTYCENLRQMFAEGTGTATKITVKWDGAPAIICGVDPADGKFFVGTKSVFSKTEPKACKSTADIKKFYSEQPDLANKLIIALKNLSKIGIGNVLQGDLMFTADTLQTADINGEECITFTPNTITYAVPANEQLAERIRGAKIGIVFHTAYEGASLPEMTASFGVSVAGLNPSKDVWFDDATYKDLTGIASLTPEENTMISRTLGAAANTLKKINPAKFNTILNNTEFSQYIKPFINSKVKGGEQVGEPTAFLQEFITFYRGKMEAEIDTLMKNSQFTEQQEELVHQYMATRDAAARKQLDKALLESGVKVAVLRRIEKIVANEEFMEDNSNTLLGVLAIYKRIIEVKLMILGKMQKVESIGTFIKTDNGYKVTAPEGFVAIGHDGGAVKLVDRLEFSKQNFSAPKQWKKD
jgi:Family of unknown function (DUF6267)